MVSIGRGALLLRNNKAHNLTEEGLTLQDDISFNQYKKKRNMGRRDGKKHSGFPADNSAEYLSGGKTADGNFKAQKSSKHQKGTSYTPFVRNQIDPETEKYFAEITNVIEGKEIDLEERSVICGNALEETRGKEVELATDYVISHTLQILLEGCSLDHLCGFLHSCAKNFSRIATDRSGSHVAETALKSLAVHLQDCDQQSLIEETLRKICETALKLLVGNEPELLHIIQVLLGCNMEMDGNFIGRPRLQKILKQVEEPAYSHLFEVIIEVAPETIYKELLQSVFKNSLFQMSSHHCGNFVVQALASHAKCSEHASGHFGELSVHPLGSFMIEKCFNASNLPLKEKIFQRCYHMQAELSKNKQGLNPT
nr:pumilio homolog 23 isoform X1 [Ipomoea batatas]